MAATRLAFSRALLVRASQPRVASVQFATRSSIAASGAYRVAPGAATRAYSDSVIPPAQEQQTSSDRQGAESATETAAATEANPDDAPFVPRYPVTKQIGRHTASRKVWPDGHHNNKSSYTAPFKLDYDQREDRLSRTIYLANLPFDLTDAEMLEEMKKFGEVEFMQRLTVKRGSVRVTFKDLAAVDPALKKLGGSFWHGRMIRAAPSMRLPNPHRTPPARTIFVDRIPRDATDAELNEIFSNLPYHPRVRLTENEEGEFRGIAYIEFSSIDQAEHTIKLLIGRKCRGKNLFFDFSDRESKRRQANAARQKRRTPYTPFDRFDKAVPTSPDDIAEAQRLKRELQEIGDETDLPFEGHFRTGN